MDDKEVSIKRQNGGIFLLAICCISLLYFRFENNVLNLLTGIILIFSLVLLCWSLCIALFAIFNISKRNQVNIKITLTSVLFSLLLLEMFLRFGYNEHSTYTEKNGLVYRSIHTPYNTGRYHLYKPHYELSYSKKEFEYYRKTNSMGLCEKELDFQKKKSDFTIIGFGDSFMEGVGTSYDSTWLQSLEFHLNEMQHKQITTINAGISGSDIIYEWVLLKEKLIEVNPDMVIFEINTSDVTDILIRGGMSRFISDSIVKYKDPPSFESFYAVSYVFRHILHDMLNYNFLLIPADEMEAKQMNAIKLINQVLLEIKEYSDKQGFEFLLIMNPREMEIKNKSYFANKFTEITKGIEDCSFDLLQYYLSNDIINEQNISSYYWEIDLHYKPKGYWQMGKIIANEIDKKLIE